ncbi:MAG: winged helix-turn-helix transcriptional regulator [Nanoarchaeota archaeon]|nr:winged helix-turn-helix transcriptional regulator [Nanoarchaeota archaeon]
MKKREKYSSETSTQASRIISKESDKSAIKTKILEIAKKQKGVITTSEIASELNISWNTAEKYLLELTLEGKLEKLKKVGANIWLYLKTKEEAEKANI